jgi:hypothetical protein
MALRHLILEVTEEPILRRRIALDGIHIQMTKMRGSHNQKETLTVAIRMR